MKKIIVMLVSLVALFSVSAMAVETEEGWKPVNSLETGQLIGMTNLGEHGGKLSLLCNTTTHKLVMHYVGSGKQYDLFVFRDFNHTDVNTQSLDGKFIVGMNSTTQGEVYYNVLKAKQAFVIARFPVGSGAKYLQALATGNENMPEIQQEGDEMFLVGSEMNKLLGALSTSCPVNQDKDKAIF